MSSSLSVKIEYDGKDILLVSGSGLKRPAAPLPESWNTHGSGRYYHVKSLTTLLVKVYAEALRLHGKAEGLI